jgi:hypothetical protein
LRGASKEKISPKGERSFKVEGSFKGEDKPQREKGASKGERSFEGGEELQRRRGSTRS